MKRLIVCFVLCSTMLMASAGTWSFSGGRIYFDNRTAQWSDCNIYLIVGKSTYSSVYEMAADVDSVGFYTVALPESGWSDAEYMAVIGNSNWSKGNFGYETLKGATHYTAAYTAGLSATSGQGFLFTPSSAENGCTITLKYLGNDSFSITFSSEDKNRCYKLDDANQQITLIFSTSSKRFNTSRSNINKVYAYGSITAWKDADEAYHLNGYSDDGCFYRVMPYSAVERPGNSGQPEFLFNVHQSDDTWYKTKASASWTDFDSRYLFENNGLNQIIAFSGDDLSEIAERASIAKYVRPLSDFDLTSSVDQHKISNFRQVPGTKYLYRSYHPYKPDRAKYDTEYQRLQWVNRLATDAGINCDIALSGNEESKAGTSYTCNGTTYTITIPDYYQKIIDNSRVLYVGTTNGHTPDFNNAVFHSDDTLFGQWFKEIVEFIIDDAHPVPFQIHCSLGADRTGMFCGTLAAICGASWDEIATDYESTSNLQINEYRHRNVLRYCLRHMTGVDPVLNSDFGEAVAQHFVDGGYVTQAQIDKMVSKLQGKTPTVIPSITTECSATQKLLYNGQIYILRDGKTYDTLGREVHLK